MTTHRNQSTLTLLLPIFQLRERRDWSNIKLGISKSFWLTLSVSGMGLMRLPVFAELPALPATHSTRGRRRRVARRCPLLSLPPTVVPALLAKASIRQQLEGILLMHVHARPGLCKQIPARRSEHLNTVPTEIRTPLHEPWVAWTVVPAAARRPVGVFRPPVWAVAVHGQASHVRWWLHLGHVGGPTEMPGHVAHVPVSVQRLKLMVLDGGKGMGVAPDVPPRGSVAGTARTPPRVSQAWSGQAWGHSRVHARTHVVRWVPLLGLLSLAAFAVLGLLLIFPSPTPCRHRLTPLVLLAPLPSLLLHHRVRASGAIAATRGVPWILLADLTLAHGSAGLLFFIACCRPATADL
mmetsp:Transcript_7958/g.17839  ORF Transcript_7958/g.17839 Transcript_7958/m.17839 type:complete len:351 (-) Transcript_7958:576-1628(-)